MKQPVWIEEGDVLAIHARSLILHGGGGGVRDKALLQSALARPRQHFNYGQDRGIVHLAGIYTAGIVANHPFVDGNKRTGFVTGILFLELNGYRFVSTEENAAHAVLQLAAGNWGEERFIEFLRRNSDRGQAARS